MVRVPVSRNRVSPQVARDPGLIVDPAAFTGAIGAAERFGPVALGVVRDIADIDDPADREKVIKRTAAQQKAVSNRVTAEGVREMLTLRDSLEQNAPAGADGFEQMFGQAAEESIARLAEQGADDQHRNEITQGLRQVGARIAEDARAFQAFKTVDHRRGAVDDLHGAFAETIQRYPQMYEELRRAGIAAVLGDEANFNPVEQVERQKAFEAQAATAAVAGMAALNADMADQELDDGRYDDVLDAGQKSQLRARIGLAREDRESELDNVRRNALADMDRKAFAFLADYRRRLADGAATRVELMDAETAGIITEAQALKLRAEFDNAAAKRNAEQQQIDRVSQVIDGGGRLDPLNDGDRHAVELHWRAALHQLFPDGPASPGFADGLIGYTEITGIVPENAFCRYGGRAMAGDDAAQRIDAAQTISTIIDLDAQAGNCLPPKLPGCARRAAELFRIGFPADKAVQCLDDIDPGFSRERPGPARSDDDVGVRHRTASADGGGEGVSDEGGEAAAKRGGGRAAPASAEAEVGEGESEEISSDTVDSDDNKLLGGMEGGDLQNDGETINGPRRAGEPKPTEVAMGAVREAAKLAAKEAARRSKEIGREIRRLLGKEGKSVAEAEKRSDLPRDVLAETVVGLAAKKFRESKRNKIEFTPSEFGENVSPEDAIQAFVEAHLEGKLVSKPGQQVAQLNLGEVNTDWAERIKSKTGVDITGFRHVIDNNHLAKAFRSHGPGNEIAPDQEPISPEAVAIYRDVVENFDRVKPPRTKGSGETITFEKDVDGMVVVVEQIRTGNRELAFFNMWIKKVR